MVIGLDKSGDSLLLYYYGIIYLVTWVNARRMLNKIVCAIIYQYQNMKWWHARDRIVAGAGSRILTVRTITSV